MKFAFTGVGMLATLFMTACGGGSGNASNANTEAALQRKTDVAKAALQEKADVLARDASIHTPPVTAKRK